MRNLSLFLLLVGATLLVPAFTTQSVDRAAATTAIHAVCGAQNETQQICPADDNENCQTCKCLESGGGFHCEGELKFATCIDGEGSCSNSKGVACGDFWRCELCDGELGCADCDQQNDCTRNVCRT